MSVSDPLLKKLKGIIYNLRTNEGTIRDSNENVQLLCKILEEILRKGMKSTGMWRQRSYDYWDWIQADTSVEKCNPIFNMLIELIKKSKRVKTSQGRGRWFIRCALQKKILSVPIEKLSHNTKVLHQWYDPLFSIIGNDILLEIFMSLLFEATEINFKLNTKNASFLDNYWLRPTYKDYEFVPCDDFGVKLQFILGRPVVVEVKQGSVAGEDNKIEPGDVLDELFGQSLLALTTNKMSSLMKEHHGWPIQLSACKCHYPNGEIYPPIQELLHEIGTDVDSLQKHTAAMANSSYNSFEAKKSPKKPPPHAQLPEDELSDVPVQNPSDKAVYKVQFIGKLNIGDYGGMCRIESSLLKVLEENEDKIHGDVDAKRCTLSLGETDVLVQDAESDTEFLRHSYTEISSCGRRTDCMRFFAYISGETTCTLAKQFVCYVFKAENDLDAKTILCSIAQGFGRTHWFV